jgi:hypothetical protein
MITGEMKAEKVSKVHLAGTADEWAALCRMLQRVGTTDAMEEDVRSFVLDIARQAKDQAVQS